MAFALKYYGEVESFKGNTIRAEIHEDGFVGSAQEFRLLEVTVNTQGSDRGDVYKPLRLSKSVVAFEDRSGAIENSLLGASYKSHKIVIKSNGVIVGQYWAAPFTDRRSLNFTDNRVEVSGKDGLADLKNILLKNSAGNIFSGEVSFKDLITTILGKTGLGLETYIAFEWYSRGIASTAVPIEEYSVDTGIFLDEEGRPPNCHDVLINILRSLHLELRQGQNRWHVIGRDLLFGTTYRRTLYDASGNRVAIESNHDPTVAVAESDIEIDRLSTSRQPVVLPYGIASVAFEHGELPNIIRQGSFSLDNIPRPHVGDHRNWDGRGGGEPRDSGGSRGGFTDRTPRDPDKTSRSLVTNTADRKAPEEKTFEVWKDQAGGSNFEVAHGVGGETDFALAMPPQFQAMSLLTKHWYREVPNFNLYYNDYWTEADTHVWQQGLRVVPDTGRKLRVALDTKINLIREGFEHLWGPAVFELRLTNPNPNVPTHYLTRELVEGRVVGAYVSEGNAWTTTRSVFHIGTHPPEKALKQELVDHPDGPPILINLNEWSTGVYLTDDLPAIDPTIPEQFWQVELYLYPTILDSNYHTTQTETGGPTDTHFWSNIMVHMVFDRGTPNAQVAALRNPNTQDTIRKEVGVPFGEAPVMGEPSAAIVDPNGNPVSSFKDSSHDTTDGDSLHLKLCREILNEQGELIEVHKADYLRDFPRVWPDQILEIDGVRYQPSSVTYDLVEEVQKGSYVEVSSAGFVPEEFSYEEHAASSSFGGSVSAHLSNLVTASKGNTLSQSLANFIAVTNEALDGATTTIPLEEPLKVDVSAGDKLVIIAPNGDFHEVTVASNAASGATSINIESYTFDRTVHHPAGIHVSDADVKAFLIQTNEALRLLIQHGKAAVLSSAVSGSVTSLPTAAGTEHDIPNGELLRVIDTETGNAYEVTVDTSTYDAAYVGPDGELLAGAPSIPIVSATVNADVDSGVELTDQTTALTVSMGEITVDSDKLQSNNFDGTFAVVNGVTTIDTPGSQGWAIAEDGTAAFEGVYARDFVSDVQADDRYLEVAGDTATGAMTFEANVNVNADLVVSDGGVVRGELDANLNPEMHVYLPDGTNHGTLVVENLIVHGTIDQKNTTELLVQDQYIVFNAGQTGTPSLNGGMMGERGNGADVYWEFDEGADAFGQRFVGDSFYEAALQKKDVRFNDIGVGIDPGSFGYRQLGGGMSVEFVATPSAPTVTVNGTTGTTSYTYYVVAVDRHGNHTTVSPGTTITNGNATLDATNYNTVSWTAVAGAVEYLVLRDSKSTWIAKTSATSIDDTGLATNAYGPRSRNETADLDVDGVASAASFSGGTSTFSGLTVGLGMSGSEQGISPEETGDRLALYTPNANGNIVRRLYFGSAASITSGAIESVSEFKFWQKAGFGGIISMDLTNQRLGIGIETPSVALDVSGEMNAARLRLSSADDVTPTSTTHAFQIGPDSAGNLAIDTNEIMARNNGAVALLHLNPAGGEVHINSNLAWHAGNDGPGSGLHADLLDGYHGADLAAREEDETIRGNWVFDPISGGPAIEFSEASGGMTYNSQEAAAYQPRYFLMFDYSNDASYPFLTNRAPSGAVVIKTGTATGGAETEHFRVGGGDGTVNTTFTSTNVGINVTPSYPFDVSGDVHLNGQVGIKRIPNGSWELDVQGDTRTSGNLQVNGSSLAMINQRWSIPSSARLLEVDTTHIYSHASSGYGQLSGNTYYDGTNYLLITGGTATRIMLHANNGYVSIQQSQDGLAGDIVTWDDKFKVNRGGKVEVPGYLNIGAPAGSGKSTDQANTTYEGYVEVPWVYTGYVEAHNERGGSSTGIAIGSTSTYTNTDEVGFITNGSIRWRVTSTGVLQTHNQGTSVGYDVGGASETCISFWRTFETSVRHLALVSDDLVSFVESDGNAVIGEMSLNNSTFNWYGTSTWHDTAQYAADVLPTNNYQGNIGLSDRKWLTIHAAELRIETIVAQERKVTMGGRWTVGYATILEADLGSGSDIAWVKHNDLLSQDILHMEKEGQLEFMRVGDLPVDVVSDTGNYFRFNGDRRQFFAVGWTFYIDTSANQGTWTITSVSYNATYNYTQVDVQEDVTSVDDTGWFLYSNDGTKYAYYIAARDLDGTGPAGGNNWIKGDGIFNTGQAGDGFIDTFARWSLTTTARTEGNIDGPTMTFKERQSATFNDIGLRMAVGNLKNKYHYGSTKIFGIAGGDPNGGWFSADPTNGFRLGDGTTIMTQLNSGALTLGYEAGEHVRLTTTDMRFIDSGGIMRMKLDGNDLYFYDTTGATFTHLTSAKLLLGNSGGGNPYVTITDGKVSIDSNTPDGGVMQVDANSLRYNARGDRVLLLQGDGNFMARAVIGREAEGKDANGNFTSDGYMWTEIDKNHLALYENRTQKQKGRATTIPYFEIGGSYAGSGGGAYGGDYNPFLRVGYSDEQHAYVTHVGFYLRGYDGGGNVLNYAYLEQDSFAVGKGITGSGYLEYTTTGGLYVDGNGTFTGTVTANAGEIAAFDIYSDVLESLSGNMEVRMGDLYDTNQYYGFHVRNSFTGRAIFMRYNTANDTPLLSAFVSGDDQINLGYNGANYFGLRARVAASNFFEVNLDNQTAHIAGFRFNSTKFFHESNNIQIVTSNAAGPATTGRMIIGMWNSNGTRPIQWMKTSDGVGTAWWGETGTGQVEFRAGTSDIRVTMGSLESTMGNYQSGDYGFAVTNLNSDQIIFGVDQTGYGFFDGNLNVDGGLSAAGANMYAGRETVNLMRNSVLNTADFYSGHYSGYTADPLKWSIQNITYSEGAADPNGGTEALQIDQSNGDGVSNSYLIQSGQTGINLENETMTISVWISGPVGAVVKVGFAGSEKSVTLQSGWQKIEHTYTPAAGTDTTWDATNGGWKFIIRFNNLGTYYVWRPQVELDVRRTVYQPTIDASIPATALDGAAQKSVLWSEYGGFGGSAQNPLIEIANGGLQGNYTAGSSGWRIDGTGSVEFRDGTIGGFTILADELRDSGNRLKLRLDTAAEAALQINTNVVGANQARYVMVGNTYGSTGWGQWGWGISSIDGNGNPLFVLADGSRQIAGWTFDTTQFTNGGTGMATGTGTAWAFWAGNATAGSAPYRVNHNGDLWATSATIEGDITATSGTFTGYMTAGNVRIGVNLDGNGSDGIRFINGTSYWYDNSGFTVFQLGGANGITYDESVSTLTVGTNVDVKGDLTGNNITGTVNVSGGSIVAASGNVVMDGAGITMLGGSAESNALTWKNDQGSIGGKIFMTTTYGYMEVQANSSLVFRMGSAMVGEFIVGDASSGPSFRLHANTFQIMDCMSGADVPAPPDNGQLRLFGNASIVDTVPRLYLKNNSGTYHLQMGSTSDRRLKKNLQRVDGATDRIMNMKPYFYNWKDDSRGKGTEIGLMWQDLNDDYPWLTQGSLDTLATVEYRKGVPLLIAGFQEQQAKIITAEHERALMLERINNLEEEVHQLKAA